MKKLLKRLGLSYKEKIVLVFLLSAFLIGTILKYSDWKRPVVFDYTNRDRQFEDLAKNSFTELGKAPAGEEKKLRAADIIKFADSLYYIKDDKRDKSSLTNIRVNINTALAGDLTGLPGIGAVIAERIIEYREIHGPYRKIEEIMNVKGIGDRKFESIKENIFIE
jgi:competence ComEA-like helix-hairpin-helix protein